MSMPSQVATAAVGMLGSFYPGLTPQNLAFALESLKKAPAKAAAISKPMTRQEVAAFLSVSMSTVNRLTAAGILHTVKIGKRAVRISADSVQSFLDNGYTAPDAPAVPADDPEWK